MSSPDLLRGAASLNALGFSEIEALVYCFLLQESPATGYRISHGIGKPTANTYKAIASLAARGALTLDEGENRLCRAVPPEELLAGLQRGFQSRRSEAETALQDLYRHEGDDRIYQLAAVDQVIDRARAMIARAERFLLVDAFPGVLQPLMEPLKAALDRQVTVAVQIYDGTELPGAIVLQNRLSSEAFSHWPGQQLSLVVDAREHLLALLTHDLQGVHQAVWSQSSFLSCMQHNHLACEFGLTALETLPDEDPRRAQIKALSLLQAEPAGLLDLRARLAGR